MSSSDSSPSPSPSPPASPVASYHGPPSLERLVDHFVASKRSLTATSHVYRSHELVTSSRLLIEEIAILNAKNAFGKRGLDDQVDTLEAIRDALIDDGDKVADEFSSTLASLDKAHLRLEKTLKTLRKTVVGTAPIHREQSEVSGVDTSQSREDENEEEKTLYHFIDEETHENLMSSLRGLIDSYHLARADIDRTLASFETNLTTISDKISGSSESSSLPDKPTIYDEPPPSISHLFHSMEEHATELASLLENLVRHYDLCVNALKHTEGGGEAARVAVQSEELTRNATPDVEESLYRNTVAEPISDEERTEMLTILEKDAMEVEDVIVEIRDRAAEMESHYQDLSTQVRKARKRNQTFRAVLKQMHETRSQIPAHLDAAVEFREKWMEINESMQSQTEELVELSVFYEQFLTGYGQLLHEVERRKNSERQMMKIADKARRDLEKLYEMDRVAREEFMEEVGHFLPRDLGAWHGLEDGGTRWEVRTIENEEQVGT